ncbi:ImmA/IrrE family metallo-endopeptidase [Ureibacillus composti]|nr:ImmA/IrrE family metallo-endopeptidase [Ureibacillus composti]
MQRTRKIPGKPRFSDATMKGYQLLNALDIRELPVDPFKIIEQCPNWYVQSWSELRKATGHKDPYNLKQKGIEARTQILRGSNEYLIVYDDTYSESRIRWTIAHEIGHIVLGHLSDFEETALNRGGLTKKQYGVLEVEAHWFAEAILAPNALLHLFSIKEAQEIAFLCDISKNASEKCEKHLNNFPWNNQPEERELLRNFYPFFYRDQHKQAIKDGIDKFYGSSLYPDFSKICRICRNCNAYIDDSLQVNCHICGKELPIIETPFVHLPQPGIFYIYSDFQKGQFYPSYDVDENKRLLFCPVCRNHEFSPDAKHCKICGTSLFNQCHSEQTNLSGEFRYCPSCGDQTVFESSGLYDYLKEIEIPDLLDYENGRYEDYIEYEHWDYIIASVYVWEQNQGAYSSLSGTKAIRDDDSLIVFTANSTQKLEIEKHEELLKSCIREYGFAEINKLEVLIL